MTTQGQTDEDAVRTQVHCMWASVADRWEEHGDYVDGRAAHLTERMLAGAALRTGDRVLELACGPGGAGLAAAVVVGTAGEVVVSDVVPEMAAIAVERGSARGLTNVRAATLDLEAIEQPDQSFDAVLCREGLMFAVEPERAVAEIGRVLRPGGRASISVWGAPEHNPWLALVFEAVSAQLGMQIPPPGIPGPFSLGEAGRLAELLVGGGFLDVTVEEVPVPLRSPSFDDWWTRTSAIAGPLAGILANLPDEVRTGIADRLRDAVQPFTTDTGLELPGMAVLATGRRP